MKQIKVYGVPMEDELKMIANDAPRFGSIHEDNEFENMHWTKMTDILLDEFLEDNPDFRFKEAIVVEDE